MQSGAVLYIALIMLILLALLGLVAMQVSGMQERMASNYRAVNLAFQDSEALARNAECALEGIVNNKPTVGCDAITAGAVKRCDATTAFEPGYWATQQLMSAKKAVNVRAIGPCISGNTMLGMGGPVNEDPNPIYQVTSFAVDDNDNPTAQAVIDTVFRP